MKYRNGDKYDGFWEFNKVCDILMMDAMLVVELYSFFKSCFMMFRFFLIVLSWVHKVMLTEH